MKIDAPINRYDGWVVIPSEIVDVAPHVADFATFVVHRQTQDIRFHPLGWAISNLETGYSVSGVDAKTRSECLHKARAFLSNISRAKMKRALAKAARDSRLR